VPWTAVGGTVCGLAVLHDAGACRAHIPHVPYANTQEGFYLYAARPDYHLLTGGVSSQRACAYAFRMPTVSGARSAVHWF